MRAGICSSWSERVTLLVPKFTWVPFPFCCGHLPFRPLEGPLQLHQKVVEVEEGEVEEGELEVEEGGQSVGG